MTQRGRKRFVPSQYPLPLHPTPPPLPKKFPLFASLKGKPHKLWVDCFFRLQIIDGVFSPECPELPDIEFKSHGLKDFIKTGFR